jgi:RNA polymerase sigma-54 factor
MSTLAENESHVAEYLLGNVDENGYLRVTIGEVAELLGAPAEQVADVLTVIQSTPPSVKPSDLVRFEKFFEGRD